VYNTPASYSADLEFKYLLGGSFNDAVNNLNYIASNDKLLMTNEFEKKNTQGNGGGGVVCLGQVRKTTKISDEIDDLTFNPPHKHEGRPET
jgi:hypothetical protein